MRKLLLSACLAVVAAMSVSTASMAAPTSMAAATIVQPGDLKWTPISGVAGAEMAVVYGNLMAAGGNYTIRVRLAAGAKIPPHWHPDAERATVLSGSILFGQGTRLTTAGTTALSAGSFLYIPAKVPHYLIARSPSIVQVTGTAPFKMINAH